ERAPRARPSGPPPGTLGAVGQVSATVMNQARAVPDLVRGLLGSARAAMGLKPDPAFASLAEAPRTLLNVDVTPQRRVATQSTSLARMKAIGEAAGGSLNDVLLAACSAALRRYLSEMGELPARSLIASIPVALPRDTSQPGGGGNAISFANVKLGTDLDDIRSRFDVIRRSSTVGREHLRTMSQAALNAYTVLISSPQLLTRVPSVGSRVPPSFNVIISNVPGQRTKRYFLGAEMEAYFPISALLHGQALNITVLSYAGGLYFGFTGCADKVPHLQRLAVYTGEALDELEREFLRGGAARRPRTQAPVKPPRAAGPRKAKPVLLKKATGKPRRLPGNVVAQSKRTSAAVRARGRRRKAEPA
ncbi:MAG: WS/DGAT domain-containing protein, partial [Steroidobacteraceae bacterium]